MNIGQPSRILSLRASLILTAPRRNMNGVTRHGKAASWNPEQRWMSKHCQPNILGGRQFIAITA